MNTQINRTNLLKTSIFALLATVAFQQSLAAEEIMLSKRIAAPELQVPPRPQFTANKPGAAISQPQIEVVFVLDTTGSMSGLIKAAKEKIWSIAGTMAQAQTAPQVKMGLVAYRDRGDAYITQSLDLSDDLDSMYSRLMDFRAAGGGDGPESVNQALYDAVHKMSWNQDQSTYKVIFLVGDAPAHMDYQDDVQYPQTIKIARDKGIVINAIQSSNNVRTTVNWKRIAKLGKGNYFQVGQSGNAISIATPYDDDLAKLSSQMDKTRIYYGNAEEKVKQRAKVDASKKLHRESSTASQARRATYNASVSGKRNFLGDKELVAEIVAGAVVLDSIETEALPTEMQAMKPATRQTYIKEKSAARRELSTKIKSLAAKRDAYLKQKVEASGLGASSLDAQIFDAIKEQSADKGLVYEKKDMKY